MNVTNEKYVTYHASSCDCLVPCKMKVNPVLSPRKKIPFNAKEKNKHMKTLITKQSIFDNEIQLNKYGINLI